MQTNPTTMRSSRSLRKSFDGQATPDSNEPSFAAEPPAFPESEPGPSSSSPQPAGDSVDAAPRAPPLHAKSQTHPVLNRFSMMSQRVRSPLVSLQRNTVMALQNAAQRAAPDQGSTSKAVDRLRSQRPHLIKAGKHAGRALVTWRLGSGLGAAVWRARTALLDPFTTMMRLKLTPLLTFFLVFYIFTFFFWSVFYWWLYSTEPECFNGFEDLEYQGQGAFVSAFQLSVETQMTIGYGFRSTNPCWRAAWLVALQVTSALLFDAIVLGVIFVKISHPKYRARTVFLSDTAVVARKNGVLRFSARLGDSRRRQILNTRVTAFLYSWIEDSTLEGEQIPYRVEELQLSPIVGSLLVLPTLVEHIIDHRSPLFGHTTQSLGALNAEIVVSVECCDDIGQIFRVRRSYLAHELRFGYQFKSILKQGASQHQGHRSHLVQLEDFHSVEIQPALRGLDDWDPSSLSDYVVFSQPSAKAALPSPTAVGESTLVISRCLVAHPSKESSESGGPAWDLRVRLGDTAPRLHTDVSVRMHLIRLRRPLPLQTQQFLRSGSGDALHSMLPPPDAVSTIELALTVENQSSTRDLLLEFPVEAVHRIDSSSPLARWRIDGDRQALVPEMGSLVLVTLRAVSLSPSSSQINVKRSVFELPGDLSVNAAFMPCVSRYMRGIGLALALSNSSPGLQVQLNRPSEHPVGTQDSSGLQSPAGGSPKAILSLSSPDIASAVPWEQGAASTSEPRTAASTSAAPANPLTKFIKDLKALTVTHLPRKDAPPSKRRPRGGRLPTLHEPELESEEEEGQSSQPQAGKTFNYSFAAAPPASSAPLAQALARERTESITSESMGAFKHGGAARLGGPPVILWQCFHSTIDYTGGGGGTA